MDKLKGRGTVGDGLYFLYIEAEFPAGEKFKFFSKKVKTTEQYSDPGCCE